MFNIFKKKRTSVAPLQVDIHSHLIPGVDDGSKSIEESIALLKEFERLGFKKVITTPHIMSDFYPNTPDDILKKLEELRMAARELGVSVEIEAAAEYYLDEVFLDLLEDKTQLLTFGDKYLLIETGFINQPVVLYEAIFKTKSLGLQPVLAHPERYQYVQENYQLVRDLVDRGALLQLNLNSISGYYSQPAQKVAKKLIDDELISFVGSDMHNDKHARLLSDSINKKYFDKLLKLNLLNNSLLN